VADFNGNLTADDRAGKLPFDANVTGLSATSYLTYSQKWRDLAPEQRTQVKAKLPFPRVEAAEPGVENGYWEQDRTYSANGSGLRRSILKRYGA
jgi:hypothetical protein